ncbi:MAG: tRNA (adenosine(37)-N6)-dimethylallyltransferase MiaA [Candidatus Promineifilaceae bacterium]
MAGIEQIPDAGGGRSGYPPLLVIVGPTAVGKTDFSLEVASEHPAEIVSADSRLVYRGLDIGTDKPSMAVREQVPHHLIDICQPDERLSLGQYQRLAYFAIADIQRRGRLPILVGGTGQYVHAVVEGWNIPAVPPNDKLRRALSKKGQTELARWLKILDPASAERIDFRNIRRVVRALEITLTTGLPASAQRRKKDPELDIMQIGLAANREQLHARVDIRVNSMIGRGLLEEVKALRDQGYERHLSSMSGLGYRQLYAYLDGELTLEEAVERIKFESHRFIRQQANWFRQDDTAINWFEVTQPGWQGRAINAIGEWLGASYASV